MTRDTIATAVAIGLIVIGILLILGELTIGWILSWLGVVLIVVGILVLLRTLPGGTLVGIVALVIGILMLQGFLPDDVRLRGDWVQFLNIIAGAVLLALGIMKLNAAKA